MRPVERLLTVLATALLLAPAACVPTEPEAVEPPALVVLVAVDQLRTDLIERYDSFYTGGFRRLLDQGAFFSQGSHAHASTATAPGHATIATGVFPARHGIVGNSWSEEQPDGSFRSVYAVEDSLSPIIGFPQLEGRSPRNLERSGIADWMLAADPAARSLSVSTKDRSAITLGGQGGEDRAHVYWLNVPAGRFVTSTHYRGSNPNWVERFNRERVPDLLSDSIWVSGAPEGARDLARPDDASYEGDGVHTTFPHLRADEAQGDSPMQGRQWLAGTPTPDAVLLAFVREAMGELELGTRGSTDFLAVSFSQTDYVGHGYGPFSQEQLSNLMHLDRVLGEFLTLLDERVGEGRWILGLSADHGVVTMPEHLSELGIQAARTPPEFGDDLARVVQEALAEGETEEEVRDGLISRLEAMPFVADVARPSEFEGEPADSFLVLFRNSYRAERRTGLLPQFNLLVRFTEHTLLTGGPQGTSHGSPYWYDRSVPYVVMGPSVAPGRSLEPVFTVDLAPTLATLAGVEFPEDLNGRTPGPRR